MKINNGFVEILGILKQEFMPLDDFGLVRSTVQANCIDFIEIHKNANRLFLTVTKIKLNITWVLGIYTDLNEADKDLIELQKYVNFRKGGI